MKIRGVISGCIGEASKPYMVKDSAGQDCEKIKVTWQNPSKNMRNEDEMDKAHFDFMVKKGAFEVIA